MRITIRFGFDHKKEVSWYQDIMDFPKLMKFNGKRWEWFSYQKDPNSSWNDYELTFSELPVYDPSYYSDMKSFEEMFEGAKGDGCECGAAFSSFKWDHMRLCKLWKPWDKI